MDEMSDRVIELEIRYTHQQALIEELNIELTTANDRIDRLEKDLRVLHKMISSMEQTPQQSPDE